MTRPTCNIMQDNKGKIYKYVVIANNRCNQDVFWTNDKEEATEAHNTYRSFGSHVTTYEDGLVMLVST